ncbi:hypothetical protein PVK06_020542 [Gossypium arboreum]|uniref:Uncharacterized protein n=1 Tax=Gossypium arboreum TaxID=29729 RepID=A0ABR0PN58_GOSAR|nr:hypothetical protein PVK06_020542 [Gossypium arboreum]
MVVLIEIEGFEVKKILVDNDRVVEVLSWRAYKKMSLKVQPLSATNPLYSFVNHPDEVRQNNLWPRRKAINLDELDVRKEH